MAVAAALKGRSAALNKQQTNSRRRLPSVQIYFATLSLSAALKRHSPQAVRLKRQSYTAALKKQSLWAIKDTVAVASRNKDTFVIGCRIKETVTVDCHIKETVAAGTFFIFCPRIS